MRRFRYLLLFTAGIALGLPLTAAVVSADDPHPPCEGIRVQFGGGSSFTVPAPPDGYVWVSFYSKSANNDHQAQDATVGATWTSGEFNAQGVEQDISHVDGCKILIVTTTTTTTVAPTTTTTTTLPDTTTTTSTTLPDTTTTSSTVPDDTTTTVVDTTTTTGVDTTTTVPDTTTTSPDGGSTTTTDPAVTTTTDPVVTTTTGPDTDPDGGRLPLTR